MIITKTPLRISFVGGGTDLPDYFMKNDGAVVSSGINKYMYITVNSKFDNMLRVSYSKTEMVDDVEDLHHELVKESLRMVGITNGIEITSISDIPSGTGLGSSSAFTVGLLNALYTYIGNQLSAEQLAERACEIEIDILGHSIGKQDSYAAAYGGINYFQFKKDGTVNRKHIFLSDNDARNMRQKLMLLYTGETRDANDVLKEQKKNIVDKMTVLDFMKGQADEMCNYLLTNGFDRKFGEMIHEGWMHKQVLSSLITNPQINKWYEDAIKAGAVGGKLLGAGGGGFLLFYCDEDKQKNVERALGLRRVDFHPNLMGSRVIFSS